MPSSPPDPYAPATGNNTNYGSNAWPNWEVQVLRDLGAPVSKDNIGFLGLWQSYEHSAAKYNPLNLTAPAGIGSINSVGVQSYSNPQDAAKYTADSIRAYPAIYNMLRSDDVSGTLFNNNKLGDLASEIRTWGSKSFADYLEGNQSTATKAERAAKKPFHDLASAWDWVAGDWQRILFVIGGAILVIIALLLVAKSSSNNTFTFDRGDS